MKPDPGKKNFSLLWILGGVTVAATAALIFNRSKKPLTDEEYIEKEQEFLIHGPEFIEKLRQKLDTEQSERRAEAARSLHYFEHKLKVMEEAFATFPDSLAGRKAMYAVERALYKIDHDETSDSTDDS